MLQVIEAGKDLANKICLRYLCTSLLFMKSLFENFLYLDSQGRCKTLEKLSVDLELRKKALLCGQKIVEAGLVKFSV